jgi:hypothetical protein
MQARSAFGYVRSEHRLLLIVRIADLTHLLQFERDHA